jgi:hypothetical protein
MYSEETCPECHFVHRKLHYPGSNPGRYRGKAVVDSLSYDTALLGRPASVCTRETGSNMSVNFSLLTHVCALYSADKGSALVCTPPRMDL